MLFHSDGPWDFSSDPVRDVKQDVFKQQVGILYKNKVRVPGNKGSGLLHLGNAPGNVSSSLWPALMPFSGDIT